MTQPGVNKQLHFFIAEEQFLVLDSTLLLLPPIRFPCVGGYILWTLTAYLLNILN